MTKTLPQYPNVRVERDGHVTTVTIDRTEAKNACTGIMWVELGEAFRAISYSGTRAVVLTGAGGDFCAGADLGGSGSFGSDADAKVDGGGADGIDDGSPSGTGMFLDAMRLLGDSVLAIHGCPVPVIAKVDGVCIGAGFGLALAADMIWCSDRARFSAIFAKRGLSLDFGTSWLLRQRVGAHRAKEIAFTAEMMNGARAYEMGFVNSVVPADELDDAVATVAASIAAGPPIALSMTKREINNAGNCSLAQALETEAIAQTVNLGTDDLREALMAYVQRRTPDFKGR